MAQEADDERRRSTIVGSCQVAEKASNLNAEFKMQNADRMKVTANLRILNSDFCIQAGVCSGLLGPAPLNQQ